MRHEFPQMKIYLNILLLLSCRPGSAHKLCCITFQTKNPFLLRKQLEDLCIFLKGGWRRRLAVIKCVCVVGVASFSTNCEFKQARKAWRCDSITPETITLYHWATEQGDASYRFCIYERKTYMRQFPLYRLGHREDTWMQKAIKNFLLEHWHWTVLLKVKQIKRKQDGRKVCKKSMIELKEAINISHKAMDIFLWLFWSFLENILKSLWLFSSFLENIKKVLRLLSNFQTYGFSQVFKKIYWTYDCSQIF